MPALVRGGRFMVLGALLILPVTYPVHASATHSGASLTACSTGLTLALHSGAVPPPNAPRNRPPARDIPPRPLIERFPLYPGAIPSTAAMPAQVATAMPPAYRKVARTELQLPAGYQAVSTWYQKALRACGFYAPATIPLQRHGGPPYAGLDFTSHDGLSPLTLVFRPLSPQTTAVLYIAQTLDLPPRPTASLLHGPFTRVLVSFQSHGVVSRFNHRYRFTITWQPTIARLVKAINGPAQIWVPLAPGGPVIFYHSAQLSFVRTDGGARKASVGGILDRIIVGHTRPLAAMDGRAIKLVTRIVHRRCHSAGSC